MMIYKKEMEKGFLSLTALSIIVNIIVCIVSLIFAKQNAQLKIENSQLVVENKKLIVINNELTVANNKFTVTNNELTIANTELTLTNNELIMQSTQAGDIYNIRSDEKIQVNVFKEKEIKRQEIISEKDNEKIQRDKTKFTNRPKLELINPTVTIKNWIETKEIHGRKTGYFDIKFLNIGSNPAKNLITKWTIVDNGGPVTGLNRWLTEFLRQPPLIIEKLPSLAMVEINYGPQLAASDEGILELILDCAYIDSETGEKYEEQFKGTVEYKTKRDGKSVLYNLQ